MYGLRYLELGYAQHDLLSMFDVAMVCRRRIYKYTRSFSEEGQDFPTICHLLALRRIRINVPHVVDGLPRLSDTICQKVFCLALWAGARDILGSIPVVEFQGFIDGAQRQQFLEEHALQRKGIVPYPSDLDDWQRRVLKQWYD